MTIDNSIEDIAFYINRGVTPGRWYMERRAKHTGDNNNVDRAFYLKKMPHAEGKNKNNKHNHSSGLRDMAARIQTNNPIPSS